MTPAKDYVFFIQCELFTKFGILSLRFDAISEKSADTIFRSEKNLNKLLERFHFHLKTRKCCTVPFGKVYEEKNRIQLLFILLSNIGVNCEASNNFNNLLVFFKMKFMCDTN